MDVDNVFDEPKQNAKTAAVCKETVNPYQKTQVTSSLNCESSNDDDNNVGDSDDDSNDGESSTSNSDLEDCLKIEEYTKCAPEKNVLAGESLCTNEPGTSQSVKLQLHSLLLSRSFGKNSPSIPLHLLPHQRRKLSSVDYNLEGQWQELPFSRYESKGQFTSTEINHNVSLSHVTNNSYHAAKRHCGPQHSGLESDKIATQGGISYDDV